MRLFYVKIHAPAKGVGRETGTRVQISQSAPYITENPIEQAFMLTLWDFILYVIIAKVLESFEKLNLITVPVTVLVI